MCFTVAGVRANAVVVLQSYAGNECTNKRKVNKLQDRGNVVDCFKHLSRL